MTVDLLTTVITLLLTAGGAAFLTNAVRGWSSIRSGAHAREREAIDDLGRRRDDLDRWLTESNRDRDFWRRVANRYAGQLVRAGIEPDPADPVPPSERQQPI